LDVDLSHGSSTYRVLEIGGARAAQDPKAVLPASSIDLLSGDKVASRLPAMKPLSVSPRPLVVTIRRKNATHYVKQQSLSALLDQAT